MLFGDYAKIEQERHGSPNEFYLHKVIGTLNSNGYIDVPVQTPRVEKLHKKIVPVVRCVCCGVCEEHIFKYRISDVKKQPIQN